MQKGVDLWKGSLEVTGGSFIPDRMFFYAIGFECKGIIWDNFSVDSKSVQILMKHHSGTTPASTSLPELLSKILVVILVPDGNNCDSVTGIINKANIFLDKIQTGCLPIQNAHSEYDII